MAFFYVAINFIQTEPRYTQILDVAERFVRKRGFNAFSYADIAVALGLSKAAIHHHFASKADLGLALIERFTQDVLGSLYLFDQSGENPLQKLQEYAQMFESSFHEKQMCLCRMLAAEHESLSEDMQQALASFFRTNEAWLEKTLSSGKASGKLEFDGSAAVQAQFVIANLQGALLVAKSMDSWGRINSTTQNPVKFYRIN